MNSSVYNLLSIGDILIAINGVNIEKVPYLDKIEMIKQKTRPLTLDFITNYIN